MLRHLCLNLCSVLRRQEGAGAVEFAFVAPILLFLLLAGFDFGRYVLATQRIQEVANSVAEMLSQSNAAQSPTVPVESGDAVVQDSDLHYYSDSAMVTYPDVLAVANSTGTYWWRLLTVQMTSIKFNTTPTGCTAACTYKPAVVWTTGARTCGLTISAAPDVSTYNPATLPTDVFGPGSLIVVDVFYTFTPTFGAAYLPSFAIERSAFMAPRNVPVVESQATSMAPPCAGVL
jgi:Flp pilus assembly protein TadG